MGVLMHLIDWLLRVFYNSKVTTFLKCWISFLLFINCFFLFFFAFLFYNFLNKISKISLFLLNWFKHYFKNCISVLIFLVYKGKIRKKINFTKKNKFLHQSFLFSLFSECMRQKVNFFRTSHCESYSVIISSNWDFH